MGKDGAVRISRRSLLAYAAISLGALFSTYSYFETRRIDLTRLKIGFDTKAAFLIDMHIHGFGDVEEKVVDMVSKEQPEIILIGGDIVDEFTSSMKPVQEYLSLIEAEEKYVVLGNHDYWSGRSSELTSILKSLGFRILRNDVAETGLGTLFGVDWRDDRVYGNYGEADVVLAHDPNVVESCSGRRITLAGHTHGGVVVGGLTLLTNSHYTRGLYKLSEGKILYVSRGLGQMIPFRPTSPLELVILE